MSPHRTPSHARPLMLSATVLYGLVELFALQRLRWRKRLG